MKNSYKRLLLISILLGGILLRSTSDSLIAMINALFGFLGKCSRGGGFIFTDGNIPWIVYVLTALTVTVIGLFLATVIRVVLKTKQLVNGLLSQTVDFCSPVIHRYHLAKQIPIHVVKYHQPIACCFGFYKPQILVSNSLIDRLQENELLAVLEHEYHHCKKRDPLKMLLAFSIVRAFFFIPVLKSLSDRFLMQKELEADQQAVKFIGVKSVASSLYKLLQFRETWSKSLAVGLNDVTHARIDGLISGRPVAPSIPLSRWILSTLGFSCVAVIIFYTYLSMTLVPMMGR